jgi:hypothetical protein
MIRGAYVLPQGSADKIMAPVVPGKPARGHGMFPSHPVELTQQHLKQERKPDVVQQSRIEGRIMSELILQHYSPAGHGERSSRAEFSRQRDMSPISACASSRASTASHLSLHDSRHA